MGPSVSNQSSDPPSFAPPRTSSYYYYDPIATPVNVRQRRQRQFVNADQVAKSVVVLQTGRQSPATLQIKELPPLIRTRQVPPSGFFAQGEIFPFHR